MWCVRTTRLCPSRVLDNTTNSCSLPALNTHMRSGYHGIASCAQSQPNTLHLQQPDHYDPSTPDAALTDKGVNQCNQLPSLVKHLPIDIVFVSPLSRALHVRHVRLPCMMSVRHVRLPCIFNRFCCFFLVSVTARSRMAGVSSPPLVLTQPVSERVCRGHGRLARSPSETDQTFRWSYAKKFPSE